MNLRVGNIQHSSAGWEDYTDPVFVEAGRVVLGHYDLDPASCELANTVVRAAAYWDLSDPNPLAPECEWGDGDTTVFLNPPGGKCNAAGVPLPRDHGGKQHGPGESYAAHWWEKLVHEVDAERVRAAIFVCFSLNVMQNSQELGPAKATRVVRAPFMYPFCVPKQRPRYWSRTRPVGSGAPSQPGAIVLVANHADDCSSGLPGGPCDCHRSALDPAFYKAFRPLGQVRL